MSTHNMFLWRNKNNIYQDSPFIFGFYMYKTYSVSMVMGNFDIF